MRSVKAIQNIIPEYECKKIKYLQKFNDFCLLRYKTTIAFIYYEYIVVFKQYSTTSDRYLSGTKY